MGRSNELVLLEAILANIFVNIAILSFVFSQRWWCQTLACFVSNLHVCILNKRAHCGELCFFRDCKFSVAADSIANFGVGNMLRHWGVTFIGNLIGGGFLMGLPYAFLNKNEDTYVD